MLLRSLQKCHVLNSSRISEFTVSGNRPVGLLSPDRLGFKLKKTAKSEQP